MYRVWWFAAQKDCGGFNSEVYTQPVIQIKLIPGALMSIMLYLSSLYIKMQKMVVSAPTLNGYYFKLEKKSFLFSFTFTQIYPYWYSYLLDLFKSALQLFFSCLLNFYLNWWFFQLCCADVMRDSSQRMSLDGLTKHTVICPDASKICEHTWSAAHMPFHQYINKLRDLQKSVTKMKQWNQDNYR